MSLFALSVPDNVLHVLADEAALRRLCPAPAVAAEAWLFFADDGSPLRPQFLAEGAYYLRPWASCGSCSLPQVLPFVVAVKGDTLASVDAAAHHITTERRPR